MNKEEHINKLIEEAIGSVDKVDRASPKPYLLTRINAKLNKTENSVWEKTAWLIGRPKIAITGLVMLICINVLVIVTRHNDFNPAIEQSYQAVADDFSYTVVTIDDIENTEP